MGHFLVFLKTSPGCYGSFARLAQEVQYMTTPSRENLPLSGLSDEEFSVLILAADAMKASDPSQRRLFTVLLRGLSVSWLRHLLSGENEADIEI